MEVKNGIIQKTSDELEHASHKYCCLATKFEPSEISQEHPTKAIFVRVIVSISM